eukprot:SAG22_NODE_13952_length_389_cov_2.724138_1_plen_41_part_01
MVGPLGQPDHEGSMRRLVVGQLLPVGERRVVAEVVVLALGL